MMSCLRTCRIRSTNGLPAGTEKPEKGLKKRRMIFSHAPFESRSERCRRVPCFNQRSSVAFAVALGNLRMCCQHVVSEVIAGAEPLAAVIALNHLAFAVTLGNLRMCCQHVVPEVAAFVEPFAAVIALNHIIVIVIVVIIVIGISVGMRGHDMISVIIAGAEIFAAEFAPNQLILAISGIGRRGIRGLIARGRGLIITAAGGLSWKDTDQRRTRCFPDTESCTSHNPGRPLSLLRVPLPALLCKAFR